MRRNCRVPAADLPLHVVPNRANPEMRPLHMPSTPGKRLSFSLLCVIVDVENDGCNQWAYLETHRIQARHHPRGLVTSQGKANSVELAKTSGAKAKGTHGKRNTSAPTLSP